MKEPSIDDQVTAIDGSAELLEKLRAKGYNKVYISFSGSGDVQPPYIRVGKGSNPDPGRSIQRRVGCREGESRWIGS